ncbi:hypothetical protein J7F01_40665 [Streptomyces sp. ISL-22]|uniref:hypothetical protein n=1 Tax=unclassified Streptomyces TaxID=2593676 RepID=UPI001BE5D87A|nr:MULTISPECIES: hypothetical protein [unclassified Streptomyces]MBT2421861.1 hypothetical protein [Streptomyces sp. ISL-24]MBT2438322.1 hypothetical protein [Streptomyces sp. ISL-22]
MSDPNDQDMSHPLEQATGERDVHPEEDSSRQHNEETAQNGDDSEPQADAPTTGETP